MKKIERISANEYSDLKELTNKVYHNEWALVWGKDLDCLEAENREMLKALKAICIEVETSDESDISDYAYVKAVNLIEKVSGKTWEQRKKG